MTKVLVTGGAGFIGSHLVDRLANDKCEVIVIDDLSTGRFENIKKHLDKDKVSFVKGDIRDYDTVEDCTLGVDSVVHLAAITSVPYSIRYPTRTMEVNVLGTLNLLKACVRNHVRKFVFAGSCAVYGEAKALPITEDHPLKPQSPYAKSKMSAIQYCRSFHESENIQTICLQLFNVYGPRQRNDNEGGVIPQFIHRLMKSQPPVIYGDGEQTRDFIHVEDVVSVISMALKSGVNGGIYNVGSGRPVTINQLLKTLFRVMGRTRTPIYKPKRRGDIRNSQADTRKLVATLGYEPRISLEDGIRRLLQHTPSQDPC